MALPSPCPSPPRLPCSPMLRVEVADGSSQTRGCDQAHLGTGQGADNGNQMHAKGYGDDSQCMQGTPEDNSQGSTQVFSVRMHNPWPTSCTLPIQKDGRDQEASMTSDVCTGGNDKNASGHPLQIHR
eukprot:scaffold27537_cov21-Tisochrysis_lutea.AAC.1